MRHAKEETSSCPAQAIDLVSAVKELHVLGSQELNKLLRDSENFTLQYLTEIGTLIKIDGEKLAGFLPLHLIAVSLASERDEALFRYLLCGIRLLHSLYDLAPRHSKLEQILLDDVKMLEQQIDLVFYVLIVLAGYRQEDRAFSLGYLVHSTLVACSLYLLTGFLSPQWPDLVHVLLAHPKVDIFMDAAFASVRVVVRFLDITLSTYERKSDLTTERVVYYLCQQCEASLQFLQSLCQQKSFKERLLKNKDLCGKGGILFLAESILNLNMQPFSLEDSRIMAAISRMKAKILSILLSLCEAESISYLDEVAKSPSLELAKSVALQVLDLLKTAFSKDPRHLATDKSYPMGLLQLNAMRLADILSDDSNFRSHITFNFTRVLTAIFSLSHGDFITCWCSSDLPEKEEDATVEYDIFSAAGWALDTTSLADLQNVRNLEFNLIPSSMLQTTSYSHQRTSLFVKVIANLHCFIPNICEEQERNVFLLKFLECLQMDLSNLLPGFPLASDAPRAATTCKNLCSLLRHSESLIPKYLNEEDVQLLRVFYGQVQSFGENRIQDGKFEGSISCDKFSKLHINAHHQEVHSAGGCSSPLLGKELVDPNKKSVNLKEGMSESSAVQDIDRFNTRAGDINLGDNLRRQDHVEDKGITNNNASEGARNIEKDAQNVDTSGSDTSSAKGKNVIDQVENGELSKLSEHTKEVGVGDNPEDEKVETVQRRKRKRTIMNDKQVQLIERALLDEPDMQRNAASIQSWADKLSLHGSEVTPSQLKNWLNNRKARLARTARDVRAAADVEASVPDKQRGPVPGSYDSPDSPYDVSNARKDLQSLSRIASIDKPDPSVNDFVDRGPSGSVQHKVGQFIVLVDKQGKEIGKGKILQLHGKWCEKSLEDLRACVVDIYELKADKVTSLPYPSDATGASFADAETKFGVVRVLWDLNSIYNIAV